MNRLIALALATATLIFGVAFATAEPTPSKPSWSEMKRAKLRAEIVGLRVENLRLRRVLRHRPDVQEAIRLAATAYGVGLDRMRRVAFCESRFNPRAANSHSSASGLYQHLYPSTWRSTPFGAESVWSPYASAMAAAYMFKNGRGSEWVCR